MRKSLIAAATAALLAGTAAHADQPGPDWMPADQVKQKLKDMGYSSITEFEADDGHWRGRV